MATIELQTVLSSETVTDITLDPGYASATDKDVITKDELGTTLTDHVSDPVAHPQYILAEDAVKWDSSYVHEDTVLKNTLVLDGVWTMISTVDTSEGAAPENIGGVVPSYDQSVALTAQSNASVVSMEHVFTLTKAGYLKNISVYTPAWDLDVVSKVILYNATTGGSAVFNNPILTEAGWTLLGTGNSLVAIGDVVHVVSEFYHSSDSSNITGGWTSLIDDALLAGANVIDFDSVTATTLVSVNHTDLDTTGRAAELDGVAVGSIIQVSETGDANRSFRAEVTAIDTVPATSTDYTVTFLSQGGNAVRDNKTCTVSIDIPITTLSEYAHNVGYYATQPTWCTVATSLEYNGVDQGAATTTAYGIDVQFQEASISDDWDVVSYSGD